MASHVPFLTVRSDDTDKIDVKTRDSAGTNATTTGSRRARASSTKTSASKAADAVKSTARKAEREVVSTAKFTGNLLRLPLVIVLSLALRLAAYTLVSEWAGLELASVSRELRQDWQVAAVFTWKVIELVGIWYAEYGWLDITSLSLISNLPYYFLLSAFYQLSALSIITSLTIDIASLALPFVLLRPNFASSHDSELQRPGTQSIVNDYSIFALTSVLATVVFSATLGLSFATWIPLHMVEHFDNLRTLDVAHSSTIWSFVKLVGPAGIAAAHFLFLPAVAASNRLLGAFDPITKDEPFDPENSTLAQTIAYNLGISKQGLSPKTEVLLKRTAALALVSVVNTFVRVFGTIEGAEVSGAIGWAGLWAGAVSLVGFAYKWVAE